MKMSKALETKKEYLDKIEAIKAERKAHIDAKIAEFAENLQKQLDEYAIKLERECDFGKIEIAKAEEVIAAIDEVIKMEQEAEDKLHLILDKPEQEAIQVGPIVVEPIKEPLIEPVAPEVFVAETVLADEPIGDIPEAESADSILPEDEPEMPIEEQAAVVAEIKEEPVKEEPVLSRPGMKIIFKR